MLVNGLRYLGIDYGYSGLVLFYNNGARGILLPGLRFRERLGSVISHRYLYPASNLRVSYRYAEKSLPKILNVSIPFIAHYCRLRCTRPPHTQGIVTLSLASADNQGSKRPFGVPQKRHILTPHLPYTQHVPGYKAKPAAVLQKVLVYSLFWKCTRLFSP